MGKNRFITYFNFLLASAFLFWGTVLPFLFPVFLFLAVMYIASGLRLYFKDDTQSPPKTGRLIILPLLCMNVLLFLFLFRLFPLFALSVLISVCALTFFRIFQLFYLLSASLIITLSFLVAFPALTNDKGKIETRFVTLIKESKSARNIFTDDAEENLYFTAHSPAGRKSGIIFETLFRIDLNRKRKPESLVYYFCPGGVYDNKRKKLFVINQDSDELLSVNPKKLTILKKRLIHRDPDDIFLDEKRDRILVLFEEGAAALYDPDTLNEIQFTRWQCCVSSKGALSEKNDMLYVAHTFNPVIVSLARLTGLQQIRRKQLGLSSWWVSLNQSESQLYVTDFFLGKVYVLNPQTLDVINSAWVQSGIRAVIVDEKRELIYAGNYLNPYLLIMNSDFKVIKKVYIGHFCRSLKLLRNGRLFAATAIGLLEVHIDKILKEKM